MNSAHGTAALPAVGFPIRTSPDQSLVSGSPTLFAATHVLLRLLSPRHPSCALCSLVISLPCSFTFSRRPGSSAAPWLTGDLPDDTFLPTCAYAIVKDRYVWGTRIAAPRLIMSPTRFPGGADRDRTDDIQLAKLALSQLSYGPGTVRGARIAAPPLIMSPARRRYLPSAARRA
jgi:hypothetical protein